MRRFGYDPMNARFDGRSKSYWVAREPNEDPNCYFRQF